MKLRAQYQGNFVFNSIYMIMKHKEKIDKVFLFMKLITLEIYQLFDETLVYFGLAFYSSWQIRVSEKVSKYNVSSGSTKVVLVLRLILQKH